MSVEPLYFETYLGVIKNSVGSFAFRNFYALEDGKKKDILKNGRLSCAFFVSTILHQFQLIKTPHAGVDGTVRDMEGEGFLKLDSPKVGAVILWEDEINEGQKHKHLGFYIGNEKVISHNEKKRMPIIHHYTYNGTRKIETIYWPKKF